MSLFRAPTFGIGVDLGTSYIKVVQLAKDARGVSLVTYAVALNPNPLIAGGGPDAVGQETLLLREMLKRAGVSRAPVVAALPILSVFSAVVELPEMPVRDLDAAVAFAARNYVPSPLSDVVLGWTPIGPPKETVATPVGGTAPTVGVPLERADQSVMGGVVGGEKSSPPLRPAQRRIQEIFLTAAPRDIVGRYTALFDRLDVRLQALEVESFPLARSLLKGEERPVLLVDLGDRTTSFAVVDGGYLRLNQAMDLGGISLTRVIAEKLSISSEEAERKKQAEGISRGDVGTQLDAAMRPVLTEIIQRGDVLRRLYERKKNRTLGRAILIGGGARLPGLTSFWTGVSGLPTEVGNPWRGVSAPKALAERLLALGPSFAVAVGLALRPFEKT